MKIAWILAVVISAVRQAVTRYKMQLPQEALIRTFVRSNSKFSVELSAAPDDMSLASANGWLQDLDLNEIRRRLETLTFQHGTSYYTLKQNDDSVIFSQQFIAATNFDAESWMMPDETNLYMLVQGEVWISGHCQTMQILSSNFTNLAGKQTQSKCLYELPQVQDLFIPVKVGSDYGVVFRQPKFFAADIEIQFGSNLTLPVDQIPKIGQISLTMGTQQIQCEIDEPNVVCETYDAPVGAYNTTLKFSKFEIAGPVLNIKSPQPNSTLEIPKPAISCATPYALTGRTLTLDTSQTMQVSYCLFNDLKMAATSQNNQTVCNVPYRAQTYSVTIPGSANQIPINVISPPIIERIINPYRTAMTHRFKGSQINTQYYVCAYQSGMQSKIVQLSQDAFECSGQGTSMWLQDLQGQILTQPVVLEPVNLVMIVDQQTYSTWVTWKVNIPSQTVCISGNHTLPTKVQPDSVTCSLHANTTQVYLQLEQQAISNAASVKQLQIPQVTLPTMVTQLKFQKFENWDCVIRIQGTIHKSHQCQFDLILNEGIYNFELWLEQLTIVSERKSCLFANVKAPEVVAYGNNLKFKILQDLRLPLQCIIPETTTAVKVTRDSCTFDFKISFKQVEFWSGEIFVARSNILHLPTLQQTPFDDLPKTVKIKNIQPMYAYDQVATDVVLELDSPVVSDCFFNDKIFKGIQLNDNLVCKDVLLPKLRHQNYQVRVYRSNSVAFDVREYLSINKIHPGIITQHTQIVQVTTNQQIFQVACVIDGQLFNATYKVDQQVFGCQVNPVRQFISVGISDGSLQVIKDLKVVLDDFLITKTLSNQNANFQIHTSQDLPDDVICVLTSQHKSLKSNVNNKQCSFFIDFTQAEFQLRIGSEIAHFQSLTFEHQPTILDFNPKIVFANTPFRLNLTYFGSLQTITVGNKTYDVFDGKVFVVHGLQQDFQLQSGKVIQVIQFQSKEIRLLKSGTLPINNQTHRLKHLKAKIGDQPVLCTNSFCEVNQSGALWITVDDKNWFKYADIIIYKQQPLKNQVVEVQSFVNVGETIADFCEIGGQRTLITHDRCQAVVVGQNLPVFVGLLQWENQKVQIGVVDVFSVQFSDVIPKMVVRNYPDQTLHMTGHNIWDFDTDFAKVKPITENKAILTIPYVDDQDQFLELSFWYKGTQAQQKISMPIVELPIISLMPVKTYTNVVKIYGSNLFQQLDIWCQFNQTQFQAKIYQNYLECSTPDDYGRLQVYSNSVGLQLANNITYKRLHAAQITYSQRHLSTQVANQTLNISFDQSILDQDYKQVIDIKIGESVNGECTNVDQMLPNTVRCLITDPIFDTGIFALMIAPFGELIKTNVYITIHDRPELVAISPQVVIKFNPTQQLTLTVRNLEPNLIKWVVFNQQLKVAPIWRQGTIVVKPPVGDKSQTVQLETIFGMSNYLVLHYSDQIIVKGLLNQGEGIVTRGIPNQSIKILGDRFSSTLPITCYFNDQTTQAQVFDSTVLCCPVGNNFFDSNLTIALQDVDQKYAVGQVQIVDKVVLTRSQPQQIVLGVPTQVILYGFWSQVRVQPLIRLQQQTIVQANYTSTTSLQFLMPSIQTSQPRITVELSQDYGRTWSEIPFEEQLTSAKVSLTPVQPPKITSITPNYILRNTTITLTITGTQLDSLIQCATVPATVTHLLAISNFTCKCQITTDFTHAVYQVTVTSSLIQHTQIGAGSVELIDLKQQQLSMPNNYTSMIFSNLNLDLPLQNKTYLIKPKQDQTIYALFGNDKVPAIQVKVFQFEVRSNHFAVQDEFVNLDGVGFTQEMMCHDGLEWRPLQVTSSTNALCQVRLHKSQNLVVKILSTIEQTQTYVTVVKRPVIQFAYIDLLDVIVTGVDLDSSDSCTCSILGVLSQGQVINSTTVKCQLPQSQHSIHCPSFDVKLQYYKGQIKTVESNSSPPVTRNFAQNLVIAYAEQITLLTPDKNRSVSVRLLDLNTCHLTGVAMCVFTSQSLPGTLRWPFVTCPIPQNTQLQQDLRIEIGRDVSNIIRGVVLYQYGVRLLQVSSILVSGVNHKVKLLMADDYDFQCLVKNLTVKPYKLSSRVYTCQVEPFTQQISFGYRNELIPDGQGQTYFKLTFVDPKIPKIQPLQMIRPQQLIIEDQDQIYDGCLFGNKYETSMPCTPPDYTSSLKLHVKNTDIYIDAGLIVEIVKPQITHLIVVSNGVMVLLTNQTQGAWTCVQKIGDLTFRSVWTSKFCQLQQFEGVISLEQGSYSTNKLLIANKTQLDANDTYFVQPTIQPFSQSTFVQTIRIFEGPQNVTIEGRFISNTSFYLDQTQLQCELMSSKLANCAVDLSPGRYRINQQVDLIVNAHTKFINQTPMPVVDTHAPITFKFFGLTQNYQLSCWISDQRGLTTVHSDFVTCHFHQQQAQNYTVTLRHDATTLAVGEVIVQDYQFLQFQVTPNFLVCDQTYKQVNLIFMNPRALMPQVISSKYKLNYVNSTHANVMIPCGTSNLTTFQLHLAPQNYHSVVIVKPFEFTYYQQGRQVFVRNRQHELVILLQYVEQRVTVKNEHFVECDDVCNLTIQNQAIANQYYNQETLQQPVLLTKQIRLGYESPIIVIMYALQSCVIGDYKLQVVIDSNLNCIVPESFNQGVYDVTADGFMVGQISIVERPKINYQGTVKINTQSTNLELNTQNAQQGVQCLFKGNRTHVVDSNVTNGVLNCQLKKLASGMYNLSLSLGTKQISSNHVQVQVLEIARFNQTLSDSESITFLGDFYPLMLQREIQIYVNDVRAELSQLSKDRMVIRFNVIELDYTLQHQVSIHTPDFNQSTLLKILPQIQIYDYFPKYIYEQVPQQILVQFNTSQDFTLCFSEFETNQKIGSNSCVLRQNQAYTSIGHGTQRAQANFIRQKIQVDFGIIDEDKVYLQGSGLNFESNVELKCVCGNISVVAFSHNSTTVECLGKVQNKVHLMSSNKYYFIQTNEVVLWQEVALNFTWQTIEIQQDQHIQNFTRDDGLVRNVYPTGVLHYSEEIEVTFESDSLKQENCLYGRTKTDQIAASKIGSMHSCVLNLRRYKQSDLINQGLVFQVKDFQTVWRFINWPKVDNTTLTNHGILISGQGFTTESQCLNDDEGVATTFLSETTLLCQGNLQSHWQLTNNYGFQRIDFSVVVPKLLIKSIWPTQGFGNNTWLYVEYDSFENLDQEFLCDFDGINQTSIVVFNFTHHRCLVPASNYIGTVDFRVYSSVSEVSYMKDFTFTYVHDIRDLYFSKQVVTLGDAVFLWGREFIRQHSYKVCCQNSTWSQQRCFETTYISPRSLQVNFHYPYEYTNFTLIQDSQLLWHFNTVLVVLPGKPCVVSSSVTQLDQGKILTVFKVQNAQVKSVAIMCRQDNKITQALVVSNQLKFSFIQCQGLQYLPGEILIGEVTIPFNITDRIEPSVNSLTPNKVIYGLEQYQFQLTGQQLYSGKIVCVFELDGQQIQAVLMDNDLKCSLNLTQQPETDSMTQIVSVKIFEKERNKLIHISNITVSTEYRPHLDDINPKILYKTSAYIQVLGRNFEHQCNCVFQSTIQNKTQQIDFISSNEVRCKVPITTTPNWYEGQSSNISAQAYSIAVQCGKQLSETSIFLLQEPFQILQGALILEEIDQKSVSLQVHNLIPELLCLITVGQTMTEEPGIVSNNKISCDLSKRHDLFTKKITWGQLQLKHLNSFNASIITYSNSVPLKFISRLVAVPTNQPYLYDLNQPINITLSYPLESKPRCEYFTDHSHFHSVFLQINKTHGSCMLPNVIGQPGTINISIRQSTSFQNQTYYSYSNQFPIQFILKPLITQIDPLFSPSHEPNLITVRGANLIQGTFILMNKTSKIELNVVSSSQATFTYPQSAPPGIFNIQLYNTLVLTLITRPNISELLPPTVEQIGSQIVTLRGVGFTTFTQCVVNNNDFVTTTWLSENLMQCTLQPQNYASYKIGYSKQTIEIKVLEHGLYFSNIMKVLVKSTPFVWKIEPNFLAADNRQLKVFVSEEIPGVKFCKAGQTVVPVIKTESITNCEKVQLLETSWSGFLQPRLDCPVVHVVYICEFKLVPGQYEIEIMDSRGQFTQSLLGENTLEVISLPKLLNVKVPATPISRTTLIQPQGENFPFGFDYKCVFGKKFCQSNFYTTATWLQPDKLICYLPDMDLRHRQFLSLKIEFGNNQSTYEITEQINILVYPQPSITKIEPNLGTVRGGTQVLVHGSNFDSSLGGIYCRFGANVVLAKVIDSDRIVQCITPEAQNAGQASFALSLNNQEDFLVLSTFTYLPQLVSVNSVTPISQDFQGITAIVISGQNFPNSKVYCRFSYDQTSGQILESVGQVQSSEKIVCFPRRQFQLDQQITLDITFNKQEYLFVQNISSFEDYRYRFQHPVWNQTSPNLYQKIMLEQADPQICPVISVNPGNKFQIDVYNSLLMDVFVQINITQAVTSMPFLQSSELLIQLIEYQQFPQIIQKYSVLNQTVFFTFYFPDSWQILPAYEIYQQIYGLYNWFSLNQGDVLACDFQRMYMATLRLFDDRSKQINDPTQARMTCNLGTQSLQNCVSRSDMLTLECVLPRFEVPAVPQDLFVNDTEVVVVNITPSYAFKQEMNINIYVRAQPIYNLTSLRCLIRDVYLPGLYFVTEGIEYIKCTIPSFIYLDTAGDGWDEPQPNYIFGVEVSLDGVRFSQSGFQFELIDTDQFKEAAYRIGPDTGGTVVEISVLDFPTVNNKAPTAACIFPGYEDQQGQGTVEAIYVDQYSLKCTSLPLRISTAAIGSGTIKDYQTYSVAKVQLQMLGYEVVYTFYFVYMKDAKIFEYIPQNVFFNPGQTTRRVNVIGQHFLPVYNNLKCRVEFTERTEVFLGHYINNHTIGCDIPAPLANLSLPATVNLSVSFNNGQQYLKSNVSFYYSAQDTINRIYPWRQFVMGNEIVQAWPSYFFDNGYRYASCKFTYTNTTGNVSSYVVKVVAQDLNKITCYIPPAYLISEELQELGGVVSFQISSNQQDYSDQFNFTYNRPAVIDSIMPPFVKMDKNIVCVIRGNNFVETSDTNILSVRLTKILTEPENHQLQPTAYSRVQTITNQTQFVSSSQVNFVFPSNVFSDKDWVTVELSFDYVTWFKSDSTQVVAKEIIIEQIRPDFQYVNVSDDVFLNIGKVWNFSRGGDVWNTTGQEDLWCSFQSEFSGTNYSIAYFVNRTLIGCQAPAFDRRQKVLVDVTYDGGVTFANSPIILWVVDPPVIQSLNVTNVYYTFEEQVFIQINGQNLDQSGYVIVRVQDQVQTIQTARNSGQNYITFIMPVQLDLRNYTVQISTDGITFLPNSTQWNVTVNKCPNGYTCTALEKTICPQGTYCSYNTTQIFEPLECPPGFYMNGTGAPACTACRAGTYCPNIGNIVEQACPEGYMCYQNSSYNPTQLMECPEGYYCPKGTKFFDPQNLLGANNMRACPNGHYCKKGTVQALAVYGNYTTPQPCRDGVVCGQTVFQEVQTNMPGSSDQYGLSECTSGHYCQQGIALDCPQGYQCGRRGLDHPQECQPGFYQPNSTQQECEMCPFGSYCYFSAMKQPIKCSPGYTCHLEGSQFPNQLCPAGSFCHIGITTNQTNSTIRSYYKPNMCLASTYCLAGMATPIVDVNNPQAAQECIAGTFCEAGSDSPEGKGKCLEGFYCPPNTFSMIPTDPGFFAEGTGNVSQEKCRPGTFQNLTQSASCQDCPTGHYCPNQMMVNPFICPEGTFSQTIGATQCTNCPLGTYSDDVGVKAEKMCTPCEPRYVCSNTGLTGMIQAQGCQEGYYCWYKTTTTTMLGNKVWSGYFGGKNITSFPEFQLCLPGKYCPKGTAASKVQQLDCLRNYFCPLGTAGFLTLSGDFDRSTNQVNKWKLISAVQNYITQTRAIMQDFEAQNATEPLEGTLFYYKQQSMFKEYNQLKWKIYKYNLNKTILAERENYLENTLLKDVKCKEDELLPPDLIVKYMANGTNLKCPKGTTSERGSWCMGQCVINAANKAPVSVLNPVSKINKVSSQQRQRTLHERLLQASNINAPERNFDVTGPGVNDQIQSQVVKPLEQVKVYFDFSKLPTKMIYNTHFQIQITDDQDSLYSLPDYFSLENDGVTIKQTILCIRIFNFSDQDRYYKVSIQLYNSVFIPYLEILAEVVSIEYSQAQRQLKDTNNTYAFIVNQLYTEGVTLPYNLVDFGNDPTLWLDFIWLQNTTSNPQKKNLDQDVFDNTYWQAKQISAVIMPWIPFFSNCDGSDSHIIPYDIFEYTQNTEQSNCTLPEYDDIRVVNPIPSYGMEPIADRCTLTIQCRYDEDLSVSKGQTIRWYQIQEVRNLFYLTESPIDVQSFFALDDSSVQQTAYNTLIQDGSDQLLNVAFNPLPGEKGIPRTIKIDFAYYQKTVDIKTVQSMNVYLLDYDGIDISGMTRDQISSNYTLIINYIPLNYFNLINQFQFSVPIYILLFALVSLIIISGTMVFWLTLLTIYKGSKPPAIRFQHLARITFSAPLSGACLAFVPVFIVGVCILIYKHTTLFASVPADFSKLGNEVGMLDEIKWRRGRCGILFFICGFIFLYIGSTLIIYIPSDSEERQIIDLKRKAKREEMLEMSIDEDGGFYEAENFERDENVNIRGALTWKRRHFFIQSVLVSLALMMKMEYSYTQIFQNNMTIFLLFFMTIDIFLEQILVRVVMSEALLVAPILVALNVTEFIMTMGAVDFKYFIGSFFIENILNVCNRSFVGPFIEKVEIFIQIVVIKAAQKFSWARNFFGDILLKQLASQLQLMSLNEYKAKTMRRIEDNPDYQQHVFEWQLEKGEGLEALLGSTLTYSFFTSGMMIIPATLLFIILFANETKIPLMYTIRQSDLIYYFVFATVMIIPQYCVDIFLLHILEIVHGYKTYDYLTYCDYRVSIRTKRWVTERQLDRSINHMFRSLDGLCFGSQYYFIVAISTWGLIFIWLGLSTLIRNNHNFFNDPLFVVFIVLAVAIWIPTQMILSKVGVAIGIWKVTSDDKISVDIGVINRLDQANNIKRLVKNVQTNPFRQKFVKTNKEWIISNLAVILGGRAFGAGENTYLRHLYQMTVNAEVIDARLKRKQDKLAQKQSLMPYNQKDMNERVEVSEDTVSDVPVNYWDVPPALAKQFCINIAHTWLDFARQNLKLKFMVADIVRAQLRSKCQKCNSKFRLQVIQKIDFNQLTLKFRKETSGLKFTKNRWRQFYKRRQIFVTLCMECAYIQTLKAGALRERDPDLQRLMAQNALKHVGAADAMIAKKLKKPQVRRIIYRWLWMTRGFLLHKQDEKMLLKKENKARIENMGLDTLFQKSSSSSEVNDKTEFF